MSGAIGNNIHVVDTGFVRPQFDASYLVIEAGRAAFIDSGTNHSVPRLLASLAENGLDEEAVDWVILTHIHLDHAGGAGLLMQQLPNAKLAVHARGARHMIDPAKLIDGARAVYGDEVVARDYGTILPVAEDRLVIPEDGAVLSLAGRKLRILDTPGHARHHFCIWDETSRGWFTGDTFGLCYPEFDLPSGRFVLPTTTPVQFDPDALRQSVARLLAAQPELIYPTHYGAFRQLPEMAALLLRQLDAMVTQALALVNAPDRHQLLIEAFRAIHLGELRAAGWQGSEQLMDQVLAIDLELNAQGVAIWLDKPA